jgi:hypothetical protein
MTDCPESEGSSRSPILLLRVLTYSAVLPLGGT